MSSVGKALGIGGANIGNRGLNLGKFRKSFDLISGGLDPSTGASSLDPVSGQVQIDPLIRELQLGGLETFKGSLGGTRDRLNSNASPFTQARVDPFLRRFEAGRGSLERELGRTGVRGTFRDRSLQDFDIAGERELGDVRALAERENLDATNQIDQALLQADTGVASQIFGQELEGLRIGTQASTLLREIAANFLNKQRSASTGLNIASAEAGIRQGENLLGTIGGGLLAFGGGGATGTPLTSAASNSLAQGGGFGNGIQALFPGNR